MKQIIATLLLALPIITMAQSPQKMNYQGIARDAGGLVLQNQNISLRLSILSGSVSGTTEYSESQTTTTSNLGLFNVEIGGGNVLSGSFSSINWGSESHFVKVEMDPTGGTAYQFMGASQLLSTPYALFAETSGSAASVSSTREFYIYEEMQALGWESVIGPFSNGWYTRILNNTATSTGTSISRIGNVLTIDSIGTYYFDVSCNSVWDFNNISHQARLRNTTANTTDLNGMSEASGNSATIKGVVEVSAVPTSYEIQHWYYSGIQGGDPASTSEPEIHSRVVIEKID